MKNIIFFRRIANGDCLYHNKKSTSTIQTGAKEKAVSQWDSRYGGADKSYDTDLLILRLSKGKTLKTK